VNHSLYGADRLTHLKIVVVGPLCATLILAAGTFACMSEAAAPPVKAGQPTILSGQLPVIR
jgi:hypothetical protein